MRLFVLTAGFGEGHNAAARSLAAAANDRYGADTARVVDVFALARPRVNALVRRGYLGLINRAPRIWSSAYAWLDRGDRGPALVAGLTRETRVLGELIARERPDVLCSTYPMYAFMLQRLAARGQSLPPHFNVVTDSISINSLWWRVPCAGWFVPNDESAAVLHQAGIDSNRVHVSGFPVARFFADHETLLAPPDLAVGESPRVLYIINSGTRGAAETAERLLARSDWDVTCTVGRDNALRARLEACVARRSRPAQILGWTDEIPRLLMTHHIVVSKAGGATTQEAIAARCPMLVNQIVPGQEEGNYELLRRHGVGALVETPEGVLAAVERAVADGGRVWREWRTALDRLARPRAARDIIWTVEALSAPTTEDVTSAAADSLPRPA